MRAVIAILALILIFIAGYQVLKVQQPRHPFAVTPDQIMRHLDQQNTPPFTQNQNNVRKSSIPGTNVKQPIKKINVVLNYRQDNTSTIFQTTTLTVAVPLSSNSNEAEKAQATKPQTIELGDFRVSANYQKNALHLTVEDLKTNKALYRQLFQFDRRLQNQFMGEHGFTGLTYIFHPQTKGELQIIGRLGKGELPTSTSSNAPSHNIAHAMPHQFPNRSTSMLSKQTRARKARQRKLMH